VSRASRGAIGLVGFTIALSGLIAFVGNPFGGSGESGSSGGSGATTSAPTFTSTQTDGGASFVAPTSGRVYLDGPTNSVYLTYDGGAVGVVGAPLSGTGGYENLAPDVTATMLGRDLSLSTLVLTHNETGTDTLILLGGRLRLAPVEINANAWIDFDVSSGIRFGQQMNNCAGCALLTDVIFPRQSGVPLAIGGNDGVKIGCASSPGTCDATHKGAAVCVTETATSATRICRCILTTSVAGDYRWLNTDNATRGSSTTDCPDTTP
jgi:hypothetical protein